MSDRLTELNRQRALLAEHLAWIDREIAAARGEAPAPVPAPPPPPVPAAPAAPAPDVDALFERLRAEEQGRGQLSKQGCWIVFAALLAAGLALLAIATFLIYR